MFLLVAFFALVEDALVLLDLVHHLLVVLIGLVKFLGLIGQSDLDVFAAEDGLKVDPLALDLEPGLDALVDFVDVFDPLFDLTLDSTGVF